MSRLPTALTLTLALLCGAALPACGDSEPEPDPVADTEDTASDLQNPADTETAGCTSSAECIQTLGTAGAPCATALCTADGVCKVISEPDGLSCGDGDVCSGPRACKSGQCKATLLECDDETPCTIDECDTAKVECVHTPVADCHCLDDADCLDDNPCDGGQVCALNQCVADPSTALDCYTGDPCSDDSCDAATGQCVSVGNGQCECQDDADCDASAACFDPPTCTGFQCVAGAPKDCDDDEPCTLDTCQTLDNSCSHSPNPDCGPPCVVDTDCLDTDLCDGPTVCEGNFCAPKALPVTCDDNDVCTADSCTPKTGQCVFEPLPDCPPG